MMRRRSASYMARAAWQGAPGPPRWAFRGWQEAGRVVGWASHVRHAEIGSARQVRGRLQDRIAGAAALDIFLRPVLLSFAVLSSQQGSASAAILNVYSAVRLFSE